MQRALMSCGLGGRWGDQGVQGDQGEVGQGVSADSVRERCVDACECVYGLDSGCVMRDGSSRFYGSKTHAPMFIWPTEGWVVVGHVSVFSDVCVCVEDVCV